MLKNLIGQYGWIVVVALAIAIFMAFATPFGTFIGSAFVGVIKGGGQTLDHIQGEGFEDNLEYYYDKFEVSFEYKEAGLYIGNTMLSSWEELCEHGYIVVKKDPDDMLTKISTLYNGYTNDSAATLAGDVVLRAGPSVIKEYGFAKCNQMTAITLKKIQRIDEYAFYNCTALQSITIDSGEMLKLIDTNALSGCTALKTIYFNGTSEQFSKIGIREQNLPQVVKVVCSDKTISIQFS